MPYIRTIQALNDKALESFLEEAFQGEDILIWIRCVKTCYIRSHRAEGKPLPKQACLLGAQIKERLEQELGRGLQLPPDKAEAFIQRYLEETL